MKRFFDLFRGRPSKPPPSSRRPQTVRLGVEKLEDRLVPAASGNLLQAVAVNNGSAAFFLNTRGDLCEKTVSGATVDLLPGFPQFSAGVDRFGNADVFTLARNNTMLEFNSQGVQAIAVPPGVQVKEFAAVHGDRVYMVGTDGSLWQLSPVINHNGGSILIAPAGSAQFVDAVTQISGVDALFVVRGNGQLQECVNGVFTGLAGGDFIPGPNFFRLNQISAGLDAFGDADVSALSTGTNFGELWRWTGTAGWIEEGAANQFIGISSTTNGTVFCVTASGSLGKFDAQNNFHKVGSNAFEVAAASSNDAYFASFDQSLWEDTTVLFANIALRREGPGSVLL
jgi:hypothetical protein